MGAGPERRLGPLQRGGMPIALAAGQLERYAPEPNLGLVVDPVDAPHIGTAVEDVKVFVLPGAAFAGDAGPAEEEGGHQLRPWTRRWEASPLEKFVLPKHKHCTE
jgi:hypothetical protein